MKKRIAGVIVLAGLMALFAGCGDDNVNQNDTGQAEVADDVIEQLDTVVDSLGDQGMDDLDHDATITPDDGNDAGADVEADAGPDATNDAGGDAVEPDDAGSDTGDDTVTDAGEDVATDAFEDAIEDSAADTAGEDLIFPWDSGYDAEQDAAADVAGEDMNGADEGDGDLPGEDTTIDDVPVDDIAIQDVPVDTFVPGPVEITGVVPESAVENTAFLLTVTGTGFINGMNVRIVGDNALTSGYEATPDSVSILDGGSKMEAVFPASNGLIRGYYRVEVLSGGVLMDSVPGFRILASGAVPPVIDDVNPDTAKTGRDRMTTISGQGFQAGAAVVLTGYGETYECSYVEVADSGTLTAVVPAGTSQIPVGEYEIWVVNPDGLAGKWASMFKISDLAPPSIISISPARAGNSVAVDMTITGIDFQEGAVASLVGPTGDIVLSTTVVTAGTVLIASIPAGLTAGIYPVKVTNPDQQYDTFYFYQVSNNSPGSLTTFEAMSEKLNISRWQHGLDAMVDGIGHGFLVVTGGMDSSGMPIDDVEISQVSPNGSPGAWFVPVQTDPVSGLRIVNRMNEPRSGAASVRVGKTLFIVGGRSLPDAAAPALDSMEMTRMLTDSGSPNMRAPQGLALGGMLPEGRWLYRVSAVTAAGETLASSSVSYRGDADMLTMSWEPVSGAIAYNIYRCPAAGCTYGQEVAVSWMRDASSRTFVDDGTGILTPSPSGLDSAAYPDDPGSLSSVTYSYQVTSVVEIDGTTTFESVPGKAHDVTVPGGSGVVTLVWDDVPAADYFRVYRTNGTGTPVLVQEVAAGTLSFDDDLSVSALTDTPPAGVMPLPTGSLSLFEYVRDSSDQQVLLNIPREGARATFVETQFDETDPAALTGVIFVVGGRPSFEPLPEVESSVEAISFYIDGSVGQPVVQGVGLNTGRAFFGLGNSQDRLDNLTFEDDDDDDPVTPDCPDADTDGFFDSSCGGTDCDDTNLMVNPAATENLQNGIDDNCDGLVDVPTQGWEFASGSIPVSGPLSRRALDENPEPVFLIAMLGNEDVKQTSDTGLSDIEAVGVNLFTGELLELLEPDATPVLDWTLQSNSDNSMVHGINVALYQQYLFSFMGVGSENLGQVPTSLVAQSKRFPFCPPPEVGDPGDSSFGCPGYASWTYSDLAGNKRTSANATVSGGLGYYGLTRAFGYIYMVAGVNSSGVSDGTWRVLQ